MMHDYMKNNDINIKNDTDVNSIMRDVMSVLLEGALDEELDEELGSSKILPIVKEWQERPLEEWEKGHSWHACWRLFIQKQRFSSVSSIRSVIQRSLFHTKISKN